MLNQLTNELSHIKLDAVTDFMVSTNFPENLSLEAYQGIQQVLLVFAYSMVNNEDIKLVDSWLIKVAQKIKVLEEGILSGLDAPKFLC